MKSHSSDVGLSVHYKNIRHKVTSQSKERSEVILQIKIKYYARAIKVNLRAASRNHPNQTSISTKSRRNVHLRPGDLNILLKLKLYFNSSAHV